MTDREKAVVMAYTGVCMLANDKLGLFYRYVQDKLGRCVMTHELAYPEVMDAIKEASRDDFIELCKSSDEPRVMTLEEVIKHYSLPPVFVDDMSAQEDYLQDIAPLYFDFPLCDSWVVHWRGYYSVRTHLDDWKASYGKKWRCWTARPTDEQREAVKWDE